MRSARVGTSDRDLVARLQAEGQAVDPYFRELAEKEEAAAMVDCSKCGARAGMECRTPAGFHAKTHRERVQALQQSRASSKPSLASLLAKAPKPAAAKGRKRNWNEVISELIDGAERPSRQGSQDSSGPHELWHATERSNLPSLLQAGVRAPSWWGSRDIAEWYAEDMEDPVLLRVPVDRFRKILPDTNSVAEPLTRVLGVDEEEVWDAWKAAEGTWQDSYRIVQSVRTNHVVRITPNDVTELRG